MNELFPASEYSLRQSRVAEAMRRHGLDALLVSADTNVFYFSGYKPVVPWSTLTRANFALLPADGDPILLVHQVWQGGAKADSPWTDVRGFPQTQSLPLPELADCLLDRGLLRARIGLELGYEQRLGISAQDLDTLRGVLPGARWVDGSAALWDVRMIKSPAEIAMMRRSGEINAAAFAAAYSALTPELTEAELAASLQSAITRQGADFGFMAPCFVPDSYEAMSRLPGSRRLQPGQLIWGDLGSVYGGYWSDFSRAAVIGRASPRQRSLWQSVHEVTQAGIAAVRAGQPVREVVAACDGAARRLDVAMNFASGRIGHGLGMLLTEPPHIAAYEDLPLQAGMVITLEPGIVSREGVYIVEQNVVVTETGADLLSAGRWEIWEI